jgi:ABC-type multidrug transport system ATPase subunit
MSALTSLQNHAKTMLRIHHVTRTFGQICANDDISLDVYEGEILGLLGDNGAGKTTLVHQTLGLLKPSQGEIWLEDTNIVHHPNYVKARAGFLPQGSIALPYVTVRRALYDAGRFRGQNHTQAQNQIDELLERLNLSSYQDRYINKLSGGMTRMTNFAMALMAYPKFLVLDEPTNNMDPQNRRLVWEMISQLNRDRQVTCLLVTHNLLEAQEVVQRVAVMRRGRIVALGQPGELRQTNVIQLEFRLKDGVKLPESIAAVESRPGLYCIQVTTDQIGTATDLIVKQIGMDSLDDFRLAPPSLEDVYLKLGSLNDESHR